MIIRQGIYKKIQQKDIRDIIEKNFSDFLPPWMEGVLEWTQNAYVNFKDHHKYLIKNNSASKTVSIFFLIPPTTVIMAWLFLNEKLNNLDLVGFAVATLGVYIATRK